MSGERRSTPNEPLADTKSVIAVPPGQSPEGLCLLVSTTHGARAERLPGARTILGRAADADIVVPDDSVSRLHAELLVEPDRILLTDLESRNGITADGMRLRKGGSAELQVGSTFKLGSATIVLHRASEFLGGAAEHRPHGGPHATPPAGPDADSAVLQDPAMLRLFGILEIVAQTSLSILLLGETGVGKEVFAEAVHKRSPRADKPLVKINCAAMPEPLLESELFGHERGAFTGANQAKPGLFETAHEGTMFLDEIGEMPFGTQSKLLRVLETGELRRVGGVSTRKIDVRIVSATNLDPRVAIMEKRFRSDLFFRINGLTLDIPPLRERAGDILPLAQAFLARLSAKARRPTPRLSRTAEALLLRHSWPGNVRELRTTMERALAFCRTSELQPEDFHFKLEPKPTADKETMAPPAPGRLDPEADTSSISVPVSGRDRPSAPFRSRLDGLTQEMVLDALNQAAGNQSAAARALGISRRALIYRIEHYGIGRPRKR